jgi:hypothetical protein
MLQFSDFRVKYNVLLAFDSVLPDFQPPQPMLLRRRRPTVG